MSDRLEPVRPRVVDTSFLFAAFHRTDPRRKDALRRFSDPGPAVVPNEVLVELLGLSKAKLGRHEAATIERALEATPHVELGHATDLEAAMRLRRERGELSLVDAVVVTMAWRLGCDLDTFDDVQRRVWRDRR